MWVFDTLILKLLLDFKLEIATDCFQLNIKDGDW